MPLTLAIIPCLIITVGGERFAIPQINLEELVALYDEEVVSKLETTGEREVYRLRNHLLPMIRMAEILGHAKPLDVRARTAVTRRHSEAREELRTRFETAKEIQDRDALRALRQSLNFAVVKAGNRRFGLIIDQVLGQEEIVVKPMHPKLKELACYAGATVMGDGKVALILNIDGIGAHAGVSVETEEPQDSDSQKGRSADETQSVLLFKSGSEEQFAVSLPLVKRIEKIKLADIERVGSREFITVDEVSTRILRLDHVLKVSLCQDRDEMFLLLPKHVHRPFGILISSLNDVVESTIDLSTGTHIEDGVLGTAIIRERLTLLLDIYRLIEKLEPDWFAERRENHPVPDGKRKILLAEDVLFFRKLVQGYLEADGYEVATADDGRQALEKAAQTRFDLVVSDIEMPEMDGWDFIREFRRDERNRNVPAIALTALDTEKDRERSLNSGFDRFLVKINRELLLAEVAGILNRQEGGKP
jgi:two-component system chemotaxis sensor kinase CheA